MKTSLKYQSQKALMNRNLSFIKSNFRELVMVKLVAEGIPILQLVEFQNEDFKQDACLIQARRRYRKYYKITYRASEMIYEYITDYKVQYVKYGNGNSSPFLFQNLRGLKLNRSNIHSMLKKLILKILDDPNLVNKVLDAEDIKRLRGFLTKSRPHGNFDYSSLPISILLKYQMVF